MSDPKFFSNVFLSIGAMKAGTTWLYAVLNRHPALNFALEKEIHYFYHCYVNKNQLSDVNRLKTAEKRYIRRFNPEASNIDFVRQNLNWVTAYLDRPVDDFWYRNLFEMRRGQEYVCDFSNLNAHLPAQAWPEIEAKCEKLRVLYTMRDPVKRLWSHTKFHLQFSGQLDKLETWGPGDFETFVRQPHIWDNAEYGRVLRKLKQGLAPDSWKAIFYEDVHADQRGTLRQIEEFLDLPAFHYPDDMLNRRFTESVSRPMPDFFAEIIEQDVARICQEVQDEGFELPQKWGR
mmetsp:Transcript_23218/g.39868  ORF Transcript_23218/g.39868 Transcript_23218/m.39868 type:complete len:289 (+) Transcript_23218:2074-2940(+)